MIRNTSLHRWMFVLMMAMLPFVVMARKHKAVDTADKPLLTQDEQQYFDSLYFLSITLEQRDMADSAMHQMLSAVEFYDSILKSRGYLVRLKFPTEPELPLPKGMCVPVTQQVPGFAAANFFLYQNYRRQNSVECLTYITRAVAVDSVNYWYTEAEGNLHMALSRIEDARVCYERLVRNYPEKSDPLINMSEIYLRLDSIDLCLKTLDRLEELDGISPQLTNYKFTILQENGRIEEGFDEYRKLIARYPYNVQYRIHLGNLQMQNGQIPQAKQTYDEARAIEPDNAYVWVAEANYYSMTGDQEAADTLVARALTNANLDVETKVEVMTEYLKGSFRKLSQYREAVAPGQSHQDMDTTAFAERVQALFSEVATMHPTADAIYELQAQWHSAMDQDSLATESMRFAVDLKPTSQDYWERMLYYAAQWMPKDQLVIMAQEATQQHPSSQTAYQIAAWAYLNLDDKMGAIGQYRHAIEHMSPPDANQVSQLWGNIGDIYYQMDSLEQTWECYERAILYNPTNYSSLNNYAYYLSESQKDLTKAEQMALKVIQKYPDNPTYLDTYAWILYLEGSYPLAIFYQQHAIDCIAEGDKGNSTLYDHYGDMLVKNHDLTGAAEQWRKALECDDCDNADVIRKKVESAELLSR